MILRIIKINSAIFIFFQGRPIKGSKHKGYGGKTMAWHGFARTREHHFATLNQGFFFFVGLDDFLLLPVCFKMRKKLSHVTFSQFDFELKMMSV